MIKFREQFDKLVKAYMNDEIRPHECVSCFVGNLLNNTAYWSSARHRVILGSCGTDWTDEEMSMLGSERRRKILKGVRSIIKEGDNTYTVKDIVRLENTFMHIIGWDCLNYVTLEEEEREERLFEAFCVTLQLLKRIHEANGEIVEDYVFEKRPSVVEKVQ